MLEPGSMIWSVTSSGWSPGGMKRVGWGVLNVVGFGVAEMWWEGRGLGFRGVVEKGKDRVVRNGEGFREGEVGMGRCERRIRAAAASIVLFFADENNLNFK